MKNRRKIKWIVAAALYLVHSASFAGETVLYQDIPAGQSPFPKTPPQVDTQAAKDLANQYNSGLYQNPPKVHIPQEGTSMPAGSSSTAGAPSAASPGAATPGAGVPAGEAPSTFWGKDGLEYDLETGVSTGNYDPSKVQSSGAQAPMGQDAGAASGGAAPSTAEVGADAGGSESGATTAGAKPATPGENVPAGYMENTAALAKAVQVMNSVLAQAPAQNAVFSAPGMVEISKGAAAYQSTHKLCIQEQASASTWCRDQTNPGMQNTLMMISAAGGAINAVAVKDACSTFSKIMSIAQAGITAYTLSCGAMKKKCDVTCGKTQAGVTALKAGMAVPFTCTPAVPTVPSGCPALLGQYQSSLAQIKTIVSREMVVADDKSVAGKVRLCTGEYTKLLASAGISLLTLAHSYKQGQKCEENSDGRGSVNASASAPAQTPAKSVSGPAVDVASGSAGTTPAPVESIVKPAEQEVILAPKKTDVVEVKIEPRKKSAYDDYLPGGSLDPNKRSIAGDESWRREVTGPGGRSNWQKMSERYRYFDALP